MSNKKLTQLPEKITSLSADDLLYVSTNGQSKSIKASTLEAPLKAYADQKKSEVISEIEAVDSKLDSEITNRTAADTSVLNSANAYADQKKSEVESSLQSSVNAEQSARIAADQSLQSQINNILNNVDPAALDSLSEVVAAFQEADSDLSGTIISLTNTITGNLNTEITARQSADSNLLSQINEEVTSRAAAISNEASARLSADQSLQSSLNSEITRATGVESSLQAQISQEVSDRQAAISQEVSDRNAAIYTATTGHIIPRETLVYDLGSPEYRFRDLYLSGSTIILGDTTISSNANGALDLQAGATVGGELIVSTSLLYSEILVEEAARTSQDAYLDAQINTEQSARISADSSLQSQITAEISARQAAITSEQSARTAGDSSTLSSAQSYTNSVAAALVPAGVISMYAGSVAPSGYLLCDGSAVSRSTYSALFAVIGTTYGAGNGSTTFNLPNPDSNANIKLIIKI